MEITMDALWIGLIATSVIAFLLKYLGHSVPEKWLSHPRVTKINGLIPIALLSALVAVQTFTNGKSLVVDQRLAVIALILKAPFAIVVLSAAATSAGLYHLQ
jgi:hypothetical protein